MNVKIYVEGGGDDKETRSRCREGFNKLIKNAGIEGRMPRIVACGGRSKTYNRFAAAAAQVGEYKPLLLVDSEDPVEGGNTAWEHLRRRDDWIRPAGTDEAQAQLMTTCMETWIAADRAALRSFFGAELRESALPAEVNLEARPRDEIQRALENATRACGPTKAYCKGRRSFQVLSRLDPTTLKTRLPHFVEFLKALDKYL